MGDTKLFHVSCGAAKQGQAGSEDEQDDGGQECVLTVGFVTSVGLGERACVRLVR